MTTLRKRGIPEKLVNFIKEMYKDYTNRIIHEGKISDLFSIKSGVKQECILSPIIFLLTLDEIIKRMIEGNKRGIQWGLLQRFRLSRRYMLTIAKTEGHATKTAKS